MVEAMSTWLTEWLEGELDVKLDPDELLKELETGREALGAGAR